MMASPQCLGYRNEKGTIRREYCNPSDEVIINQVVTRVKEENLKAVFISSEENSLITELQDALPQVGQHSIQDFKLPTDDDSMSDRYV